MRSKIRDKIEIAILETCQKYGGFGQPVFPEATHQLYEWFDREIGEQKPSFSDNITDMAETMCIDDYIEKKMRGIYGGVTDRGLRRLFELKHPEIYWLRKNYLSMVILFSTIITPILINVL